MIVRVGTALRAFAHGIYGCRPTLLACANMDGQFQLWFEGLFTSGRDYGPRRLGIRCCVIVLSVIAQSNCSSPRAPIEAGIPEYQAMIARSLDHFSDSHPQAHYSISQPWRPLVGDFMVCVRKDLPDGRGGIAPTSDYSMFHFADGRIISVIKDNTFAGCPNREYVTLKPIVR